MVDARLGKPVDAWCYSDAEGRPLFWVARYETEAGKAIRPWRWDGSRWTQGAAPKPRPLYGLPRLAAPDRPVLIVEGERCADSAHACLGRDWACVSWPGGAAGVQHADWTALYGRKVVVWGDRDAPGRKAAEDIRRVLAAHAEVEALDVGGANDHWDVADLLDAEGESSVQRFVQDCPRLPAPEVAPDKDTEWKPHGMNGRTLLESDMPDPVTLCDPWLFEGVQLLAGRPKLGKTTLLRQKVIAIATGGLFFGSKCKQGRVLFLSLEENARLMRKKLQAARYVAADVEGIDFHFDWPRGLEGATAIAGYLDANPETTYVVVDGLTRFRELPDKNKPAFIADYEAMQHLHAVLIDRPGRAIEVLHHTRKGKADDPIEDISGTYGLTAACDSYAVMRFHADGAVLHVGGRLWDRDESQFTLRRASQRWELTGVANDMTPEQREVLAEVLQAGGMTPSELARRRNVTRQAAGKILGRLASLGLLVPAQGTYLLPKRES